MSGVLFTNYRPVFVHPTTRLPLAGGTVAFFELETTTPKEVFSDIDLSVSLGSAVELDAEGRTPTAVYLSGPYSYELLDADDVQVDQTDGLNNVAAAGYLALDPADGEDGQVASSDGTDALWRTILEVPSPAGHSNKVLKAIDDETYAWLAEQTVPTYDADNLPGGITATATRLVIGDVAMVWGNDSAAATNTLKTTKAITFATAFSGTPYHVGVIPTSASSTGESGACSSQALSATATGFTASFFAGAEDQGGTAEINTSVPFTYFAIGPA